MLPESLRKSHLIPILLVSFLLSWTGAHAQKLHFAHVTDCHVGSNSGAADLEKTVNDINNQQDIEFVLLTGDITEFGSNDELLKAKAIIDKFQKPWYIVPGNHDSKWSESGNNSFARIFGSERFYFRKNGFLFVGTASGPNMRMAPGLVPREQILFLDSLFKKRKDPTEPVIFVNHYPLDESLSNWYDIVDSLRKTNIQVTLLGHGHANRLFNFDGIPGIMGRANLQTKEIGAGYNLVTITNDTIYYNERRSNGITLPCWCKVALHKNSNTSSALPELLVQDVTPKSARPDYSVNLKYSNVKTIWHSQDKNDIGTAISIWKNQAVYANTGGEIISLDLRTGKKCWNFSTGGKIYATPAIANNRVVCASTDHNIYCLDLLSGKLIWMYPTLHPIVASAAIEKDRVYIGSSEGIFRCLNLTDGKLIWKYDSVRNFVESKPLLLHGSVCFGSWGNTFYSLDKNSGTLNWKREKYTNRMLSPAAVWPVAGEGKIFLVAPDRHMTALDEKSGREIWDSGKYSCRESIGISADGRLVYIKNMTEGNVDAFFTSGNEQKLAWESPAGLGYEIAPSPIVESGQYIYVPTASGTVVSVSRKTHQVVWKHKISNALVNSVLPVGKHKLLVSLMDGEIEYLEF
jgi:outer membrane protein assembly factor BamB/predicted MPP superfamily phosphohydrolase